MSNETCVACEAKDEVIAALIASLERLAKPVVRTPGGPSTVMPNIHPSIPNVYPYNVLDNTYNDHHHNTV